MDQSSDNFFQVSVKGLFFDQGNKVLMIQEKGGLWEIPGGRIQKGEQFIDCLKRECLEETGLECDVLDSQPYITYPTVDLEGHPRVMVFYRVNFNSLDFKSTEEAVTMQFFDKTEIKNLNIYPQLKPLLEFL